MCQYIYILYESGLQVDNNVTRHLPTEMLESDFDLLILHYLGLDHIGHMAGPHSPLIPPKLREMDQVIDTVYRALTEVSKVKNLAGSILRYNLKIISIKLKITRLIPLPELKQIVEHFVMRINKIIIWLESCLLQPGFSSLLIFRNTLRRIEFKMWRGGELNISIRHSILSYYLKSIDAGRRTAQSVDSVWGPWDE